MERPASTTPSRAQESHGIHAQPSHTGRAASHHDESIKDLVGGLFVDVRELIAAHAESMSLEIREELKTLSSASRTYVLAVGAYSVAALLAVNGLAHLGAVVFGIPLWASYCGFALLFVGIGVFLRRTPTPQELIASGEADLVPERGLGKAKDSAEGIVDDVSRAMR